MKQQYLNKVSDNNSYCQAKGHFAAVLNVLEGKTKKAI